MWTVLWNHDSRVGKITILESDKTRFWSRGNHEEIILIVIFVIVYGRMVEIYLMTSLAPIPFSTFGNREQSQIGQNYLRSLFALGFQGFLIIICVGIYAVLVQSVAFSDDIIASIWGVMGYTVLLCFTLFKTGSLAKSVFSAH